MKDYDTSYLPCCFKQQDNKQGKLTHRCVAAEGKSLEAERSSSNFGLNLFGMLNARAREDAKHPFLRVDFMLTVSTTPNATVNTFMLTQPPRPFSFVERIFERRGQSKCDL